MRACPALPFSEVRSFVVMIIPLTPPYTHTPTQPHINAGRMSLPTMGLEEMMGLKPGEVATGVSACVRSIDLIEGW